MVSTQVNESGVNERLLQELNDEMAVSMIPVMVYLGILMVTGIVGNIMVCYYYGWKTRTTSNSIFICTVAVYDLASCSLSIPIEIVDLRLFYMFRNSSACTFMRFINHVAAIGSVFILLMIAADRFRRICRPFKRQLRIREAKIVCGLSVLVALFFSWPALVFYKSVTSHLTTTDGVDIEGSDCTTTREESYRIYLWVFNGIYLVSFITSALVLCVLYTLIGRVLYRHKQTRKRYSRPVSAMSGHSSEAALKEVVLSDDESNGDVITLNAPARNVSDFTTNVNKERENDDPGLKSINSNGDIDNKECDNHNVLEMETNHAQEVRKTESDKNPNQLDLKTIKYTTIMLVITVVFIISFLPYLVLVIWRAFQDGNHADYDSSVPFQIGIRSYFLNSALNPVTYGFFNSKFRTFFALKLCPCCIRGKENATLSTSSGAS